MLAILLCVSACEGGAVVDGSIDAPAGSGSADAPALVDAPPGGLMPGSLAVSWIHGSQSCGANTDPELQVPWSTC